MAFTGGGSPWVAVSPGNGIDERAGVWGLADTAGGRNWAALLSLPLAMPLPLSFQVPPVLKPELELVRFPKFRDLAGELDELVLGLLAIADFCWSSAIALDFCHLLYQTVPALALASPPLGVTTGRLLPPK